MGESEQKIIYRLNDEVSFRICSLKDGEGCCYGDCTNYQKKCDIDKVNYLCSQDGFHYHCTKHPQIELDVKYDHDDPYFTCSICKNIIEIDSLSQVRSQCQKLYNRKDFKEVKLVRLDDYYIREYKPKKSIEVSDYWVKPEIKTDKDGDTLIVLYIGYNGEKDKTQFFIKPEKLQLTNDYNDMDPAKIISKIEVTLKDRTLTQIYDEK